MSIITPQIVFAIASMINLSITFVLNGLKENNGWIISAKVLNLIIAIIIIVFAFVKYP